MSTNVRHMRYLVSLDTATQNRVVGAGVGDMLLTCHSAATDPGDGGCEAGRV